MTESEAIKICNTIIFASSLSNPQGTTLNTTKEELAEAIGMAIQALEKQIPKKRNSYNCPVCYHYFEDGECFTYCPECGQRLDVKQNE